MADVEAGVDITVEGAGSLRDAAEAARNLASALKDAEGSAGSIGGAFESAARSLSSLRNDAEEAARALASVRNAGGELGDVAAGAESAAAGLSQMRDDATEAEAAFESLVAAGPDIADIAAFAEQDAAALGHLRDEAVEAEAAVDSLSGSGAGLAGDAAGADAYAAALGHVRDNAAEAVAASKASAAGIPGSWEKTVAEVKGAMAFMEQGETAMFSKVGAQQFTEVITKDADQLQLLGAKVKGVKTGLDDLGNTAASRLSKLNLDQDAIAARQAADDWAASLRKAKAAAEEAEPVIQEAEMTSTGLRGAMEDLGKSPGMSFTGGIISGWKDLLSGAKDADSALKDVDTTAKDAGDGLLNIGANVGALGSAFSGLGEAVSGAMGPLTGILLPGAIVGGIGALTAAAPGVVALGASFGSLGILALPALDKVKTGLTNVTTAQQAYQQAQGVEARDPSKSNLEAQQKALATLQTTWAQMPKPIAASVQSIQSFEHAFSKASAKSGIQGDVLGDIPKALKAAQEAIPSLVGLAKSAAPVLSNMLGDLGSNVKSKQFQSFIGSIEKDVGPAANSFHRLAGAVGSFLSDLQEKGGKAGTQFLDQFATLMKNTSGPSSSGLINTVKAMTSLMETAEKIKPAGQQAGSLLGGLTDFFTKGPAFMSSPSFLTHVQSILNAGGSGGGVLDKILELGGPTPQQVGQAQKAGRQVAQAASEGANDTMRLHGITSALRIRAKIDPDESALKAVEHTDIRIHATIDVSKARAEIEKTLSPTSGQFAPKATIPATAKVNKTDTSGLKSSDAQVPATAKVDKVDSSSVAAAAKNVQIHGVTVNLSDAKLSGLGALSGSMSQAGQDAGKAFDSGVESGISSGAGGARAAASTVVNDVRGALSPLGGDGNAAGAALAAGLAAGIRAGTGAAVAAATAMANAVTAAVRAAHATQSPSKVFKGIAADDVAGLVLGLQGGKSQVQTAAQDMAAGVTKPFTDSTITTTITKLQDDITKALKAGHISPLQETEYSAALAYDNKRLMSLAKQRAAIETKIQAADQLYTSVVQATVAGANVATISGTVVTPFQQAEAMDTGTSSASATPSGPSSIQAGLKQYLSQTKQFRSDIVKLKKEGLDETSIQQLLQAGVTTGLPAAKMMLSGGQAGVQEIAKLQKQIGQAAKQLGVTGANASYESGSQIGKGLAQGLKGELSGIEDAIKSLAKSIVTEIKDDLKIKSPSQVAFDIGAQFAAGMAGGIKNGTPMVALSGKALAQAAAAGAATLPMLGAGAHTTPMALAGGGHTTPMATAGGGGSQTGEIHIHLEVGGTELANVVQKFSLQKARRNTATGLKLAGRGV